MCQNGYEVVESVKGVIHESIYHSLSRSLPVLPGRRLPVLGGVRQVHLRAQILPGGSQLWQFVPKNWNLSPSGSYGGPCLQRRLLL